MNPSALFIRRPVMTVLVMLTLAFFGIIAYRALPVSNLPDVDFPTIEVTVSYPGASPETVATNVVVPLEQQFTTIEGLQTMSSTSYTGSATMVLRFNLDRNIDLAAPDVQQAISAAGPQLPKNLPYAPTYTKANPTATPILIFVITSETMTLGDLYNYAYVVLAQHLNIVEGVSQVQTYGSPYACRLRVDPEKLHARGIGLDDAANALKAANVNEPLGTFFGKKREYTVNATGQLFNANDFNPIIIKNKDGSIVRFSDIGQAIDSTQDDKYFFRFFEKTGNKPMVALGIRKDPTANTLEVIEKINAMLPKLRAEIPASVDIVRVFDQSDYISESVHEVQFTLLLAILLVVFVIFIYLGKVRDTLIPIIAIPMALLGTCVIMYFLGFTIDVLSLLAITLSIGFLVDDAIVVLENIVRHIELGESPMQAALKGSKEIAFTVVSMTLSLCAIFIPLVFMSGLLGRILHEFAVTIVTAVFISGFISLTLTPLLCSRFLPPHNEKKEKNRLERFSDTLNHLIVRIYEPSLEWALRHKLLILSGGILSLVLSVFILVKLPKDFMPAEDSGMLQGFVHAIDGTSPFLIADYMDELSKILADDPNVENVTSVGANPQDNEGIMYIRLKPYKERLSLIPLIQHLMPKVSQIPGVAVFLKPLPLINLQVGTSTSKAGYQYTLLSLQSKDLYDVGPKMEQKMKSLHTITDVSSDLDINQPQVNIEILRDKASIYNISAQEIENVLGYAYATTNLTPINTPSYQFYGIMEVFPHYYKDPSQLPQLWLRSSTNDMVPLSAISKVTEGIGPLTVNHLNGLPSATIAFNLSGKTPLTTAMADIDKIASELLPTSVTGSVQGAANIFVQSFASLEILLVIALFIIYVILGILYENYFPPITVMSTLPPAALGGILSLLIFGLPLSLTAFIGFIMLLGIVMKNGIIMIDFANHTRIHEKKSIHDAIHHACMVRCRPILMTTFAAMMGAVPIALGLGGMSADSRRPLGIVIVGGLIFSQILTLYLTPVIYVYIETLHENLRKKFFKDEDETQQMPPVNASE